MRNGINRDDYGGSFTDYRRLHGTTASISPRNRSRRMTHLLRENSYEPELSCFGGALSFVMTEVVSA